MYRPKVRLEQLIENHSLMAFYMLFHYDKKGEFYGGVATKRGKGKSSIATEKGKKSAHCDKKGGFGFCFYAPDREDRSLTETTGGPRASRMVASEVSPEVKFKLSVLSLFLRWRCAIH